MTSPHGNLRAVGRRRALICGISGQDGAYLADLLLKRDYEVWGTSRDAQLSDFKNLARLGIRERVRTISMSPTDFRSVLQVIALAAPEEIYNLAGQASVGLSFDQPVETMESISGGILNLLEAVRFANPRIRIYNAGSGECFGDSGHIADEQSPFRPKSPYGVAKAAAIWQVATYREAYGLFACSGILFNHESPLRPDRYVTRKIVSAACRIYRGSPETLALGNIDIARDWGWAPDYVEAMWLMLQQREPQDLVIATGQSMRLSEFVACVFAELGREWQDHVKVDQALHRPTEIMFSAGSPQKAAQVLGWHPRHVARDVARLMVQCELTGNARVAQTAAVAPSN